MGDDVELVCTGEMFRAVEPEGVRWLDPERDLGLFQQSARERGDEPPSRADLEQWDLQGYRYCGVVAGGVLLAKAAIWAYSDIAWELAAVSTMPEHRGRGLGKCVCSFATGHILGAQRLATCHTAATNIAMLRVAERLGYRRR
jgi:RimJ/RimL family protein N-acetyltransferase